MHQGLAALKLYPEIPQQKVLNDPESKTQKGHDSPNMTAQM